MSRPTDPFFVRGLGHRVLWIVSVAFVLLSISLVSRAQEASPTPMIPADPAAVVDSEAEDPPPQPPAEKAEGGRRKAEGGKVEGGKVEGGAGRKTEDGSPALVGSASPVDSASSVAPVVGANVPAPTVSATVTPGASGSPGLPRSSDLPGPSGAPSAASPSPDGAKILHPAAGYGGWLGGDGSPAARAGAGASPAAHPVEPPSAASLAMTFVGLLGLCALGLVVLRQRLGLAAPGGKGQRKLVVSETRPLGNRQFLLVVEYESRRVLLGVTPGKIDYLCELPPPSAAGPSSGLPDAAASEAGAAPAVKTDYGALLDQQQRRQPPPTP